MTRQAAWAPFLSELELSMFLTLVEAEVRSHGVAYEMGDGEIEIEWQEGAQRLGLSNLAQVCKGIPAGDWPNAIAKHFDLVFGSVEEEAELRAVVADFEKVRSMLRVRLYESWIDDYVLKHVAEGLSAALVFDLPSAMRSVSRAEMRAWNLSEDVLFDAAMANLVLEETPETHVIRGPEEVPITVAESSSYYNASRALLLERDVIPEGHPYGALVAIPNRHVFFYHLIEDARVILAVNALVSLAGEAYRRGPGSISHQVFWTRRGALHRIPCEVEGGALHVSPPPLFVKEVLDRLRAPPS
jgi:hypothetical protein